MPPQTSLQARGSISSWTPKNVANSLRLDFRVPSAPEDARPATPGQAGSPSATSRRRFAVGFPSRISRTHANRAGVARRRPRPRPLRRAETPADGMSNKRCAQTSASSPTLCANNQVDRGHLACSALCFFRPKASQDFCTGAKCPAYCPFRVDLSEDGHKTIQRPHTTARPLLPLG